MVFLYLSKIIPTLLAPFSLALLLLVAGLWLRRWRTRLLVSAVLVVLIPACPWVSDYLLGTLERQYPDRGLEALPPADAIVVLGGSVGSPGGVHRASHIVDASDRLMAALRLYHSGKAPLILCSGGSQALFGEARKPPESGIMSSVLEEWGVPGSAILTEERSLNTHENAIWSHDLLAARGIHKILLVTSAMHMPRAAATFRKAGFEVVPVPADFRTGWDQEVLDWIPNSSSLKDTERALHEWLGLWTYRLRGWAA